jgi:aminopeptidase N
MKRIFYILIILVWLPGYSQLIKNNETRKFDIQFTDIQWEINPHHFYISGNVKHIIQINSVAPEKIDFDLNNSLNVDSVFLNNKIVTFEHINNKIYVNCSGNKKDTIQIYYHGEPGNSGFESFSQTFHDNQPIVWTLSEPYGAVDWWPARNNLEDKTDSIRIAINCPNGFMAISNGLLSDVVNQGNGSKTYLWEHKHPIAMYLVAFAVTNFSQFNLYFEQHNADSVLVENYVYPEDSAAALEQIKELEPAFKLFSEYFGPYPFSNEKYGHAQFDWGGGMEHQTVSFVSNFDFYLLAHELSHQWFGDFITCGNFKEIWLNEGFAVFSEGLVTEKLFSQNDFINWKKYRIDRITALPGGSLYVDDTSNIWRIFDGRLTYSKGGMVLQMLRSQIGDEAFFQGVRQYLNDASLANSFAETSDLQQHFENASGEQLSNFFQQWIYEQGFPIYTINYGYSENSVQIIVNQKPSVLNGPVFHLKLPFLIEGKNADTIIWLENTQKEQIYTVDPKFVPSKIRFNPYFDILAKWKEEDLIFDKNEVLLFPNPADDSINIMLKKPGTAFGYRLYNKKSQLLQKSNEELISPSKIDISMLKSGNYYLELIINGEKIHSTFVKL